MPPVLLMVQCTDHHHQPFNDLDKHTKKKQQHSKNKRGAETSSRSECRLQYYQYNTILRTAVVTSIKASDLTMGTLFHNRAFDARSHTSTYFNINVSKLSFHLQSLLRWQRRPTCCASHGSLFWVPYRTVPTLRRQNQDTAIKAGNIPRYSIR